MHISRCDFGWVPAGFVHCLTAALNDLSLAGIWEGEEPEGTLARQERYHLLLMSLARVGEVHL